MKKAAAVMLGLAWTLISLMALHALVYFVEAANTPGKGPIWLPPPTSSVMLGSVLILALVVGLLVYRRNVKRAPKWKAFSVFAFALAVLVSGALFMGQKQQEQDFMKVMSANESNSGYLLSEGRQACSWLTNQHWGPPDNYVGFGSTPWGERPKKATEAEYEFGEFSRVNNFRHTQSTSGYLEKYLQTASAPSDARIVAAAWYKMCPLQQFVHRPVGGNNSSGVGD